MKGIHEAPHCKTDTSLLGNGGVATRSKGWELEYTTSEIVHRTHRSPSPIVKITSLGIQKSFNSEIQVQSDHDHYMTGVEVSMETDTMRHSSDKRDKETGEH